MHLGFLVGFSTCMGVVFLQEEKADWLVYVADEGQAAASGTAGVSRVSCKVFRVLEAARVVVKLQEEKADWLVYVTDEGQAGHFKLVFGAGRKAGIIPAERAPRIDHVGFGLVLGADGKRIRTRDSGAVSPFCPSSDKPFP